MSHSIILQYPYEKIQIALCKQGNIITATEFHKFQAIRSTIPQIQSMLVQHQLNLSDLNFIGVNVGPGPYNKMRALLTMANGIHFAAKTPLVEASALQLLQDEFPTENSIVLLNAFADHLFYRIKIGSHVQQGASSMSQIVAMIQKENQLPMLALGNGAHAHKDLLLAQCKHIIFPEFIPSFNKLETLAMATYQKFVAHDGDFSYVKPVYFEDLATIK